MPNVTQPNKPKDNQSSDVATEWREHALAFDCQRMLFRDLLKEVLNDPEINIPVELRQRIQESFATSPKDLLAKSREFTTVYRACAVVGLDGILQVLQPTKLTSLTATYTLDLISGTAGMITGTGREIELVLAPSKWPPVEGGMAAVLLQDLGVNFIKWPDGAVFRNGQPPAIRPQGWLVVRFSVRLGELRVEEIGRYEGQK